jgi:acetyl-CoA carboxylase biotin carboxylase subunit
MFSKVFIANRGEIACRVIRACRTLNIESVIGFHEVDRSSLGVRLADFAFPLQTAEGESPRAAYLDIDQIVQAAKKTGCQAIHPGYGFLSERADFSQACEEAGLVFIGPEADCIARLGNKNQAREVMKSAGLPLVPGSDGPCESLEEALEIARGMDYPVLIKAAGGGGGRGMRRAYSEDELRVGFDQARREALASFGNDSVYLEKYVEKPRHIEIQILADNFGNVIHLGERECSIQRRFQKMLEEAPSSFIDDKTRHAMGKAAVDGAKAAGYRGVGTFEFLVDAKMNFYFLEVNTRLQVEHPVTEEVTGVDLVCEQLRVASGEKLRLTQGDIVCRGWAIECRITCEDPDLNFTPAVGRVEGLRLPAGPGVRVDTHLYQGYQVPNDFDSMLAKLVVTGADRNAAIARTLGALDEFELAGFPTSMPFHRWLLQHERFVKGDFSTHFLEEEFDGLPEDGTDDLDLLTLAAVLKHQQSGSASGPKSNGQSDGNWARSSRMAGLGNWS